ncbi:SusC/RagA family TonB-linked outer membrane protein [Flavivirga spongiicola]|uniref:TonB-dependent receptor n=1 Tax=Flavivirga spongiicola TaxID=421621 RepID=A0ABU7XTV9_9FLAO|nr:TonB-dependent receptor [Flavivirga sp. MEBiC05379]MDO5979002.1 TonB-dependent receptor [Flavivirga sp. MEBiC05379]
MRTFIFLFCATVFSLTPENVVSQNSKIKIEKDKTLTVDEVFDLIMDQTDYNFFYEEGIFKDFPNVHVKKGVVRTNKLLKRSLLQGDFEIIITNDYDILIKKKNLNAVNIQQGHKVSGTITDQSGQPLAGANIIEKGTSNGAQADFDGKFSLIVADQNAVLVISYLGYTTKEAVVGNQTNIDITLVEDAASLDEVVVVGYGTQKKSSLTSSITSVDVENIQGRSTVNLTGALQGSTPGLYLRQASGRPGAGPVNIDIRGASRSTFSNIGALILVDGIATEFNNVNPEDVANISILKDAAAASIYGARAAGGVVLITTKRGKEGGLSINYNGQAGFQSSQILNNLDFLSTAEYMRFANTAQQNDATATGAAYNPVWSDAQIADAESGTGGFPRSSEWRDWIPKSFFQQNHNVNISGGSEQLKYYTSVGFLEQDGLIPNDEFLRKSIQINLDFKASEKLDLGLNLSYIKEDRNAPSANDWNGYYDLLRSAILTDPTVPFRHPNGEYNHSAWAAAGNPVYLLENSGTRQDDRDKFRANIDIKYKILDGLNFNVALGGELNHSAFNRQRLRVPLYNEDGSLLRFEGTTSVDETFSKQFHYNTLVSLDYTKSFGDHNLYGFIGYTTEKNRYDELNGNARNFINNNLREINGSVGSNEEKNASGSASEWGLKSYVGRLKYNYKEKYFIEGTLRRDGSSRISPVERYAYFPSVSGAWAISKESFMDNVDFVSNLKLRASWGKVGNQGDNLYPFTQFLNTPSGVTAFGNSPVTGAFLGTPVDNRLKWEEKTSRNLGLDFGFLNNRLTGSFDYFFDETNDILTRNPAPTTFGQSFPLTNLFSIENRGWEFEINWQETRGDFSYSVGFNISDATNKVVDYDRGGAIPGLDPKYNGFAGSTITANGRATGEWYGLLTDGLYVSQAEIDADGNLYNARPGDIRFIDADGDGDLDGDDRRPFGKSNVPHHIYGFNFSVKYKAFDLSAIFNGVGSRWQPRQNGGNYFLGYRPGPAILRSTAQNAFSLDNPNKWATWTRPTNDFGRLFGGLWPFGGESRHWNLRNYAYLRLKNLQVGYTIPSKTLESTGIGITKARIYFTGENLFTIANGFDDPIDPEADQIFSTDSRAYLSNLRNLSLGLSISF